MNSLYIPILFSLLLVSCCVEFSIAGRAIPSSAPSTVVRPLVSEDPRDFVRLRPHLNNKPEEVFGGREVKGCLPKGFRHASAPSRFVNYNPLGSGGCSSSSKRHSKKP